MSSLWGRRVCCCRQVEVVGFVLLLLLEMLQGSKMNGSLWHLVMHVMWM